MRDARRGRKFGRETNQRRAFLLGLASSLVLKGKIKTTEARAKEIRKYLEPVITRASFGTLTSRRIGTQKLTSTAAKKLHESASDYKNRLGGYLRVTKIGSRQRDGAKMAYIEFVK